MALITPWNNPVYIALGKLAPALLFGNTVLWKPAPQAHAVSERIMQMLIEAGLPPAVAGLIQGDRRAAAAIMADPGVAAVSLTGSSQAGFCAQEICSRRRIPLQAELGGNNAAIVWRDADLIEAAAQIADGAFAMAGQRCTANRRVVVHEGCKERFVELLKHETAKLEWGDPLNPATKIGPMLNAENCSRIVALVGSFARELGSVHVPHASQTEPTCDGFEGAWHPPTILCCDDPGHEVVQYESFGPVLVVLTARDWDHAIALANGVRQGLAAALFSTSSEVTARFLAEAEAGILKINRSTADAEVDVPFGGWKSSGIGPPEHGVFDVEFYTRPQTIYGYPC